MRYLFFLLVFVTAQCLYAQSSDRFQRNYGGAGYEYGYGIVQTHDDGYVMAGTTSSNGTTDGWIIKTDSIGMLIWSKVIDFSQIDVLRSIVLLPDSGFALAGFTNSTPGGDYQALIIRTDKNGDTLWTRKTGTSDWDFFYSITSTWDGGFLCAGGTYGAGNGDEDIYLVRYNANGDTLWTKTMGGARMYEARSIVETSDSLFAMVANTESMGDTLGDGWLLRLDENGDTIWTRLNGYPNSPDFLYDVCDFALLNRIMICGEYSNSDPEEFMHSLGYSGNSLFTVIAIPTSGIQRFNAIAVNRYSSYFGTIGFTSTMGNGNGDVRFYSDIPNAGFTTFGLGVPVQNWGVDEAFDIVGTRDKGFAACGFMTPFGPLLPDLYLIKIDSTGFSTQVLGIFDSQTPVSQMNAFAYPNPANQNTSIRINSEVIITEQPQLLLFDAAGRNVTSGVHIRYSETGLRNMNVELDISLLETGVYYYSIITSNSATLSGRLVITN
ncbi:MAG: T9SS type A sorting domain-containing protein [Bacteroidota bacterium]